MYAVVKTGGKQYKVAKDDKIVVDRLEAEAGSALILDEVLMVANGDQVNVGSPTVKDAVVGATILRHTRGDKIMVFRRKRRKNFRRIRGHRQDLTLIQITDIAPDGKLKPTAKKAETAKPAAKKADADKAPAAKKAAAKPAAKKATTSEKPAAKKTSAAAKKPAKASAKADKA